MQPLTIRFSARLCAGLFVLGSLLAMPACSRFPFKIGVQQGNYITPEIVAQIKPGMPQEQVRSLMGAPLLIDGFHANRWDYIYVFTPGSEVNKIRRHMVVMLADGKVSSVDIRAMDAIPDELPAASVPHLLDLDTPVAAK